jgi:hypothetical protein
MVTLDTKMKMNDDERWATLKGKVINDNIKDSIVNVVDKILSNMDTAVQSDHQTDDTYKFDVEIRQNTHGRTPNIDDIQEMCLWADDKFDDDAWVWRGWVAYNTESITAFKFAHEEDALLFAMRWA